jgi:hypothetical protein
MSDKEKAAKKVHITKDVVKGLIQASQRWMIFSHGSQQS